jgi:hypothetical protein
MRRFRRRRAASAGASRPVILRQYALCPAPGCDRLIDAWSTEVEFRDVPRREPAWPGGPLVEVPGMFVRREPVRTTATFQPCGHTITWGPHDGPDAFVMHTIEVPFDLPPGKALTRLRAIRDGALLD